MKTWSKPTPEQVANAIGKLGRPAARRYFFFGLNNPEWIEPLHERGCFANPPALIRDDAQGTVQLPDWPEGRYLVRMAAEKPEVVAGIVAALPDTDNERVRETIIDIALELPASRAAETARRVRKWGASTVSPFTQMQLSKLIAHLAKGSEASEATKLAIKVFSGKELQGERYVQTDLWEYAEGLRLCLPSLVENDPLGAIGFLVGLLNKALFNGKLVQKGTDPIDLSYIRAGEFDAPEDSIYNIENLLAVKLIQTATRAIESFNVSVDDVITKIEKRRWLIFRSISLFVLAQIAPLAISLARERMLDRELFDESGVRGPYSLLLKNRFGELTEDEKSTIIEWIITGPDLGSVGSQYQAIHGKPVSEEDKELFRKHWIRDRLLWLGENLPAALQDTLRTLQDVIGAPTEEGDNGIFWWRPKSPLTDDEFNAMSAAEVISFLRSWEPRESMNAPSAEGVGQQLQAAAKTRPGEFASAAGEYEGLRRTYVHSLLRGLGEATREGVRFDWPPVLSLATWVVEQPRGENNEVPFRREELTWEGAREAIARLMIDGLDKNLVPDDERVRVWSLIEILAEDPSPSRAEEKRDGLEPLALSISTVRGQAIRCAVKYLRWQRQIWDKSGEASFRAMERLPSARALLELHLDPTKEPSLAVRAVYGESFALLTYIDQDWARGVAERIFPRAEELRPWWWAAWSSYVRFTAPYTNVLVVLRDKYALAIERLNERPSQENADEVASHLGTHLMAFYWRGLLSLDADDLIGKYMRQASPKLRGEALGFIGRSLMNSQEPVPAPVFDRLRALWEARLATASESSHPSQFADELNRFGFWFASGKFDDDWSINEMQKVLGLGIDTTPAFAVIKHLAQIAPGRVVAAVECLELIAASRKTGIVFFLGMKEVRDILVAARSSGDPRAIESGKRIASRLAEYGDLQYRGIFN